MGSGAVSSQAEEVGGTIPRISDVGLVVGAVEVLAVPAGREVDVGPDSALADILGQAWSVETIKSVSCATL